MSDGFYDFISSVSKHYKMAIISNDLSQWSNYLRKKFDITKYFDVISISGDLKIQKPDRRIFQLTIEQLGCTAEDCIYVDDRMRNLEAARKLGMNTVLFTSSNVPYNGKIVCNFQELAQMLIPS